MFYYTLDRFEEDFAILIDDNKDVISVSRDVLGENAVLGNVFSSEDRTSFCFCSEETKKRRDRAVSLHKSLFSRAKKNR